MFFLFVSTLYIWDLIFENSLFRINTFKYKNVVQNQVEGAETKKSARKNERA